MQGDWREQADRIKVLSLKQEKASLPLSYSIAYLHQQVSLTNSFAIHYSCAQQTKNTWHSANDDYQFLRGELFLLAALNIYCFYESFSFPELVLKRKKKNKKLWANGDVFFMSSNFCLTLIYQSSHDLLKENLDFLCR